jgi:pyruvate dehydrogenase E2 component (dihydrolipoamide acetyltransferase)
MIAITMPQAGQTMEEGVIVTWLKAEGDVIKKGDILAEIETDKAVFEFESPEAGALRKILYPEGAVVAVHLPIAVLGEASEDVDAFLATLAGGGTPSAEAAAAAPGAAASQPAAAPAAKPATAPKTPSPQTGGRVPASPAARKAAEERGIDISSVGQGSGPGGRVLSTDVIGAKAPVAPSGAEIRRPMSKMRKAIGANLQLSKSTVPHFYARLTIDAAPMLAFYEAQKAKYPLSINDVILLACARAMKNFAPLRSHIDGADMVESPSVNIGIAVAVDEGLVVPVVLGVEKMTLERLAVESRRVVTAARAGKLEGVGRGTFTVTNLGMLGIEEFSAIINPPEAAILAVSAIREDVIVSGGAMRPGRVMTMTLSSDHRVVDGIIAAKFLARLKEILEHPETLL